MVRPAALRLMGWGCALLGVVALMGLLVDPRQILGAPAWSKTLKFAVSISLYSFTLHWIAQQLPRGARLIRGLFQTSGWLLVLEMGLVLLQTVRGVPSHFNVSTPFDSMVWGTMGAAISVFWMLSLVGLLLVLFQPLQSRTIAWSIRLGLLLSLVGFAEGYLMTSPNGLQQAALSAHQPVGLIGAHTVGVLHDGGPGIPVIGWSSEHGDLRIAHFVGIHGLQVLPLLAWILLQVRVLTEASRLRLLTLGFLGWLGWMALLVWQALKDESILHPHSDTLLAGAGLLVVLVTLTTLECLSARRSRTMHPALQ